MKYFSVILILVVLIGSGCVREQKVSYDVNGKSYEGYSIIKSPKAPLIIIIHDWDGLTDYEIKRVKMLSKLGYSVFAADMYGAGIRPTEINDKRKLTGELYKDREKMRELLNGALKEAKSKVRTENVVAIGYCFGGTAVLEFARSGVSLKGFVSFHGGLETPENQNYSKTKGKILILHGTADSSVTMEQFAKLAEELEKNNVNHEMISYSGAPHAFTVFGSDRYRKDADKKSWKRFVEFLEETFEK